MNLSTKDREKSMKTKRSFFQRVRWLWKVSQVVPPYFAYVGNRTIEKQLYPDFKLEVEIIMRDLTQPDRYSREELLEMLALIRREEELQNWQVPEPPKCVYCLHISPVDENGFCPAIVYDHPVADKNHQCQCSTHAAGLAEALRRDINSRLEKRL